MTTAWEILIGNSTLAVGPGITAWDHLNNQMSGGGLGTVFVESVEVDLMSEDIEVEVLEAVVEVEVSSDSVDCEVLNDEIDVEVD